MFKKVLIVFFISMLPIIELRGAIPVGAANDIPFLLNYLICVVGNILPVPFLILFAKKLLVWLSHFNKIGPFFKKIIRKADEKACKLGKYELLGLYLFVAIPIPGTGAWMGSLVATVLRLRLIPAIVVIFCGVLTSGLIMGFASYGLLDILSNLFA